METLYNTLQRQQNKAQQTQTPIAIIIVLQKLKQNFIMNSMIIRKDTNLKYLNQDTWKF